MGTKINHEQKLFVFEVSGGVSYMGFAHVYEQAAEASRRISKHRFALGSSEPVPVPRLQEMGTLAQLEQYQQLMAAYSQLKDDATWYDGQVPLAVRNTLESVRLRNTPIRIFYGDPATGRDWAEESDVKGRVSRSMGPCKVPLLVAQGDVGGSAILCANVLRIVDLMTDRELYVHPRYTPPSFKVVPEDGEFVLYRTDRPDYLEGDGPVKLAVFPTLTKAQDVEAFLLGKTHHVRRYRKAA